MNRFPLLFTLKFIFSPKKNSPSAVFALLFAWFHSKALKLPDTSGFHLTVRGCPFARGKVLTVWVQPHLRDPVSRRCVIRNNRCFYSHCRCFLFLSAVHHCNASITVIRFCAVAPGAAARGDKEPCEDGHHTAPGAITHMNNPWGPFPPTKSAQLCGGGSPRVVPERQLL